MTMRWAARSPCAAIRSASGISLAMRVESLSRAAMPASSSGLRFSCSPGTATQIRRARARRTRQENPPHPWCRAYPQSASPVSEPARRDQRASAQSRRLRPDCARHQAIIRSRQAAGEPARLIRAAACAPARTLRSTPARSHSRSHEFSELANRSDRRPRIDDLMPPDQRGSRQVHQRVSRLVDETSALLERVPVDAGPNQ